MCGKVKFSKDKIISFIVSGYKVKVDKKSYMFFRKEEDYLNLICLEKFYSVFYKHLSPNEEEQKRSCFFMSMIKKYIETLPRIESVVFYDDKETENSFIEKFPYVGDLNVVHLIKPMNREIFEKLEDIDNYDLMEVYGACSNLLLDKIKIKYIIKNEGHYNSFIRCYDARRK